MWDCGETGELNVDDKSGLGDIGSAGTDGTGRDERPQTMHAIA